MNTTKKINVNFSSLVGLKAELLRKQTEIKDAKAKEDNQLKIQKPKAKSKKKKEKKTKAEPNYTEIEDVATLKKSRVMLEAKSMLYERLKKTGGDETHTYLVDFANKSESSEDEFHREDDYDEENSDPEDDWVEYSDCFGRTRKCLRRDLPIMREKDNLVKREITKEPQPVIEVEEDTSTATVPTVEKEPEIEIMRKKWEKQMERLADKTDIHYQDVLFDEARAHGVGYYAFSQNEEERARQQENLAKLRKETEQRQKESQEIRDLKSKMEFNRLRAATVRQRVRSGLSAELTQEEEDALRAQVKSRNSNDTQEEETSPEAMEAAANRVTSQENRSDKSLVVVEDKIKAFGELLGKRPKWHEMSQEEWVYKRRKDRLGEFAPVYENFRRANCTNVTSDTRITMKDNDDRDPMRLYPTGPEPTDLWESQGPSCQEINEEQEDEKTEEIAEGAPMIQANNDETKATEDESDDDIIGPLPPSSAGNFTSAKFINSFVPQPTITAPSLPVSFDRLPPTSTLINFAVPPPMVPPPPKLLSPNSERPSPIVHSDDSSDSNDSIVIGPVPPPAMNHFSIPPAPHCGPPLVDNYVNSLSDIPLPATIQFCPTNNDVVISNPLPRNSVNDNEEMLKDGESDSSKFLNPDNIVAGLKYLREKFDHTKDS